MMPTRDELPEDAAHWTTVQIAFPRLSPDTPASCPIPRKDVMDYVRLESADTNEASEKSLVFLRTAEVDEAKCWLWQYTESDGELCYVLVSQDSSGSISLGLAAQNGLSAEQYLLAEHYDEVYWS